MLKLFLFDLILILIIAAILVLLKKKGARADVLLVIAPLLTILCHYSSLPYHWFKDGMAIDFLRSNPNLLLPIYPCNVVMWCCLIFGSDRNRGSRFGQFLADYIFWFGILSAPVGMIVNIDFFRNPTFADYDVTKGVLAHAFMLFNVLLLPTFGYIKIDLPKNLKHIFFSELMMLALGVYCNLVFTVLDSEKTAYYVNSMFLIHSPFDDTRLLTYPLIAAVALVLYFAVFWIAELIKYPKGERWTDRIRAKKSVENNNSGEIR